MALQPQSPLRSYLRLRRTHIILGCFLVSSVLAVVFSGIDIRFSRLFFDQGFTMANQAWAALLHASVDWFVYGSVASIGVAYAFNRLAGRNLWGMDGKRVVYLLLVLALGAGLIVNGILKEGFGRARPKDIVEFGGTAHFTPAYFVSNACDHNCAFSCGDCAGAFFALALAMAISRKRAVAAAAVGYGVLVSASRIASGSHFLSDTIVSFFVMLIISNALYYRMYLFNPEPVMLPPVPAPEPAPSPAALTSAAEKPPAPL
jgi:lipid A 4'-phosphatase